MAEPQATPFNSASATTPTGTVDEKAVKEIASSDFYAFLGEERIRKIANAAEISGAATLRNDGRWLTPSIRQQVLRILAPELSSVSETYAWMVVRRYRELKRWYVDQAELAEKKRLEEEAKAKAAAEKAAKAAAAKAAAAAKPAAPAAPAADAGAKPAPKVETGAKPEIAVQKPGESDATKANDANAKASPDQEKRTSPPDPHNPSPAPPQKDEAPKS